MTLEEGNRVVYVDVLRSQGSLDEVSVDLVTRSITAHSQMGPDLYLSTLQQVSHMNIQRAWNDLTYVCVGFLLFRIMEIVDLRHVLKLV